MSRRLYDQDAFALSSKLVQASRAVSAGGAVTLSGRWPPWQRGSCPSVSLLLRDDEPDRVMTATLNNSPHHCLVASRCRPSRLDSLCRLEP